MISFERELSDTTDRIFLINPDGTGEVLLDNPSDGGEPSWSPDGTRFACWWWTGGENGNTDILVVMADGTNPINLTQSPQWEFQPAWGPPGST
jgi:Tol biopolymer transport system component